MFDLNIFDWLTNRDDFKKLTNWVKLLLTGKYFVNKACVRLIIHLFTTEANSFNFSWPNFCSASEAALSRPRIIGISNRLRNSAAVPKIPPLTKWTNEKYSSKSFWIGVPERSIRFFACKPFKALYVWSLV